MGIPDTQTMIMPQTLTTFVESNSAQDEEEMVLCTQLFSRPFRHNKKGKQQLNPWVRFNGVFSGLSTQELLTIVDNNVKLFTPVEIKKATRNYSIPIGQGGSGSVYKGILPSNQVIAVKRPSQEKSTRSIRDQFTKEIVVLSQINNNNVVKLLGCCFETDIPSIVYEYIPNGTLDDHLFDEQKSCLLNWNRRLRIAVQVAEALAYLHYTIIHRDIKPSNILLGNNYVAKVSDFGISMLTDDQDEIYMVGEEPEDRWESDGFTTCAMGTYAYVDPEMNYSGRLSKKSDVYGFGVVLAQLLTRKKPFSFELLGEDRYLGSRFVQKLKDDSLVEILDEQLVKEGSMDQLMKVAHLSKRCLEYRGKDRPTMRQVVRELQDIRGI